MNDRVCEIRALYTATDLWDSGKDRELVAHRITDRLARTPFHLAARPDGNGKIVLRYRPVLLIDAIWQQFAREVPGIIGCAKCPAPNCGLVPPQRQPQRSPVLLTDVPDARMAVRWRRCSLTPSWFLDWH